jgi:hypothetical protein
VERDGTGWNANTYMTTKNTLYGAVALVLLADALGMALSQPPISELPSAASTADTQPSEDGYPGVAAAGSVVLAGSAGNLNVGNLPWPSPDRHRSRHVLARPGSPLLHPVVHLEFGNLRFGY